MNLTSINKIWLTESAIYIELKDGRIASELFANYHSFDNTTPRQRENYTISFFGIHWPDLDEDLSFEGFFNRPNQCIEAPEKIR